MGDIDQCVMHIFCVFMGLIFIQNGLQIYLRKTFDLDGKRKAESITTPLF